MIHHQVTFRTKEGYSSEITGILHNVEDGYILTRFEGEPIHIDHMNMIDWKKIDLKTYVIMISKYFPATHPKKGLETNFETKINEGTKIHTIRLNYELWKYRVNRINEHLAFLSMRQWTGSPYNYQRDGSKQIEINQFFKLGIQKIDFNNIPRGFNMNILANNDGLTLDDFNNWFKKKPKKPCAIIHLTDFKYNLLSND